MLLNSTKKPYRKAKTQSYVRGDTVDATSRAECLSSQTDVDPAKQTRLAEYIWLNSRRNRKQADHEMHISPVSIRHFAC